MAGEKYVLDCPHCGRVEGYMTTDIDDEGDAPEGDVAIEEATVQTRGGTTASRVRCPRCNRWVRPDRARPA